ncbi:MAG: hypothetical protein RLZZ383_2260, partial [Pseudomonadota bacterium]
FMRIRPSGEPVIVAVNHGDPSGQSHTVRVYRVSP